MDGDNLERPPAYLSTAALRDASEWLDGFLSSEGIDRNVNEHSFQSVLLRRPEVLALFMESGQPICVAQEQPTRVVEEANIGNRNRIDLLFFFYGSTAFDIVECKGPSQAIIGKKGLVTQSFWNAVHQAETYREGITRGRVRIWPERDRIPRIIVIGYSNDRTLSAGEEQSILNEAMLARGGKITAAYRSKTLIATTWKVLAKNAADHAQAHSLEISHSLINTVARDLLTQSIRRLAEKTHSREPMAGAIRTQIETLLTKRPNSIDLMIPHLGDKREDAVLDVRDRVQRIMCCMDDIELWEDLALDPTYRANALLQLADILLYENDGDMPCGAWHHMANYDLVALLRGNDTLLEKMSPRIMRVLSTDNSVDVVGRVSHLARYLPSKYIGTWQDNSTFSQRWAFPDPEELLLDAHRRPMLPSFVQVGYCLALHGIDDALNFMNLTSRNPRFGRDLATWHVRHAGRNSEAFMESLKRKVNDEDPRMLRFRSWHTSVYTSTKEMFQEVFAP